MKINYRQLSIMTFLSLVSLKFLVLPSVLYLHSGNMSWLVALVLMTIDGLYALLIISLMEKCKDNNILEYLNNTVGKVLAKVILAILMAQLLVQIINISKGLEFFVIENFYNNLSWVLYALPLVALTSFMMYKGIRNIARVQEIFCWAIIIGCLYIAFKSMSGVQPMVYLPMFKDGITPLFKSGFRHLSWFGSSSFLIVLFGKVDFKDKKKSVLFKYIILAILLVQLIYFVFYGLFDVTSPTHTFCISDISQFSSSRSIIDELSWLVVSLWVVTQAIQLAVYGYCFVVCFMYIFHIKSKAIVVTIVSAIIIAMAYIGSETINLEQIFFSPFVSVLVFIAQYIVPFIILLGNLVRNSKNKKRVRCGNEKEIKNTL